MWVQEGGKDWALKMWFISLETEDQGRKARNVLSHIGTRNLSGSERREENLCTLIMGCFPPRSEPQTDHWVGPDDIPTKTQDRPQK